MANQTSLDSFISQLIPSTWEHACASALRSSSRNWIHGLVDRHGNHVSKLTEATWGIDIATCFEVCNMRAIPSTFNFQTFASSMTNYFLPWLALCAQLPYETGGPWANFVSFCLAVGSPAFITYSLMITILNRYWLHQSFDQLKKNRGQYRDRIEACQTILEAAQQVPLRIAQNPIGIKSLIASKTSSDWWDNMQQSLQNTRRSVTYSLIAQMLFAAIAYLFTVISSFNNELGDPNTALQIASGSLWIWLVPVISGWIFVGTQYKADTVEEALRFQSAFLDRREQDTSLSTTGERENKQEALSVEGGLVCRSSTNPPTPIETSDDRLEIDLSKMPRSCSVSTGPTLSNENAEAQDGKIELPHGVKGDEQLQGPVYNYARLFNWSHLATNFETAFTQLPEYLPASERANSSQLGQQILADMPPRDLEAYPEWRDIPLQVTLRIVYASAAALFLQWGTTGASILIAYLTPTVGLSCRSGSYLLYGCVSILVWLCLLASMLLSHQAMLTYQELHRKKDIRDFTSWKRTWTHNLVCKAAILLRHFGKTVAFLNMGWLIASSLMEFTGGFDNCWCKGDYIGLGMKGFVVLFKTEADLRDAARRPWSGGLAMTLIVCSLSALLFGLFTKRKPY